MQQQVAVTPRVVPPSQGYAWIRDGFQLFKRSPGTWIGMLVIWFLIYAIASVIPLGGLVTGLLGAVFQGGWMIGCRNLEAGRSLRLEHLFAGFKGGHLQQLVIVGAIYLAGFIAIALLVGLVVGGAMLPILLGKAAPDEVHFGPGLLIGVVLVVGLMVPLIMAIWFSPALVVFHEEHPLNAMRLSLQACWMNAVPFLIYGLIGLALSIVAAIPLGLGFLIVAPVIVASMYAGYRDVFPGSDAVASP